MPAKSTMSLIPKYVFVKHSSQVSAVCFAFISNIDCLISGSIEGDVTLWDLNTFKELIQLNKVHTNRIIRIQSGHPNSSLSIVFLSQGKDGLLNIFTQANRELEFKIWRTIKISIISFCSFSSITLENYFLVAACDHSDPEIVNIFSPTQSCLIEKKKRTSKGKYGLPMALKLFENYSMYFLLIGHENGHMRLIKIIDNVDLLCQEVTEIGCFTDMITAIDFDAILSKGICGSCDRKVVKFSLIKRPSGQIEFKIKKEINITNPGLSFVAIRSDSKIVATGGWDKRIRVFGWKSLKTLAVIDFHKGKIESLALSSKPMSNNQEYYLAVASKDRTISLWSLYN